MKIPVLDEALVMAS